MALLDLQPDCHLPRLHPHIHNIPCNGMVCAESKRRSLISYSNIASIKENKKHQLWFFLFADCSYIPEDRSVSSGSSWSPKGPRHCSGAAPRWPVAESGPAHPRFQHPPLPGEPQSWEHHSLPKLSYRGHSWCTVAVWWLNVRFLVSLSLPLGNIHDSYEQ